MMTQGDDIMTIDADGVKKHLAESSAENLWQLKNFDDQVAASGAMGPYIEEVNVSLL